MMSNSNNHTTNRPSRSSSTALRPLSAELSTLSQADGSASLQVGNTHVLCAIHGPTAPRNTINAMGGGDDGRYGVISVVFSRGLTSSIATSTTTAAVVAPLSNTAANGDETSTAANSQQQLLHNDNNIIHHPMPPGLGATEREMEKFVHDALLTCILLDHYPRCVIQVVIQIVQADGSVLASAVNCAILALLDAGVAMRTLAMATTCCIIVDKNKNKNKNDNNNNINNNGTLVWLDPTSEEESGTGHGIVVLVTTNDGSMKTTAATSTTTTAMATTVSTTTSPIVHVMHTFGAPIPLSALLVSVEMATKYSTPAMLAFARLVVEQKVKQEIETLWS
jgi:ribonuclease PH